MTRKILTLITALLFSATLVASADEPGGIAGTVIDAQGQRVANVPMQIYELPVVERDSSRMHETRTDGRGYFVQMGLNPGTYVVLANADGRTMRCIIRNVYGGRVRRVTLKASKTAATSCEGNYASNFDPDETSDVYRIH